MCQFDGMESTQGLIHEGGAHVERSSGDPSGFATERTLTRQHVRDFLARLLVEVGHISVDNIFDEATLDENLRMESVAFIETQVALEEEFEIEIDLLRVVEINRFGGIVDYILDLMREGPSKE
jgi:acyl carrier protein